MSDSDADGPEDDIAAALDSDSAYERLSVRSMRLSRLPVVTRVRLIGAVAAVAAAVLLAVSRLLSGGGVEPTVATTLCAPALAGTPFAAVGLTVLCGTVYVRHRAGALGEDRARRIIAMEDAGTGLGLGTGGFGTAVSLFATGLYVLDPTAFGRVFRPAGFGTPPVVLRAGVAATLAVGAAAMVAGELIRD